MRDGEASSFGPRAGKRHFSGFFECSHPSTTEKEAAGGAILCLKPAILKLKITRKSFPLAEERLSPAREGFSFAREKLSFVGKRLFLVRERFFFVRERFSFEKENLSLAEESFSLVREKPFLCYFRFICPIQNLSAAVLKGEGAVFVSKSCRKGLTISVAPS